MRRVYRYYSSPSFWVVSLWAVSGWFFSKSVITLSKPAALAVPTPFSSEGDRAPTPTGRLLGDTSLSKSRFSLADIRLIGLLAAGHRGAVLISVLNGPTLTLIAGIRHPEGWSLDSVDNDIIRLSHFGSTFELPVPRAGRSLSADSPSR